MLKYLLVCSLLVALFSSCINPRRATYFNNLPDSASFPEMEAPDYQIQPKDILSITVSSQDQEASELFNRPNKTEVRSSTTSGDLMEPAGYLVNKDGFIQYLMLGSIKAQGLTSQQLAVLIRNAIIERKLLRDPVVEVRHLNYRVTVLGEVTRPAVLTIPNEKITLIEALGLAGDLTIYGRRNNVLLIRTEQGRRTTQRIDLNSSELLRSPYYYLKPNDVVYVEPNKARVLAGSRWVLFLPALVSGLTVLVVVVDRLTQ